MGKAHSVPNSTDSDKDTKSQHSYGSCEDALAAQDNDQELPDVVQRTGGLNMSSPGTNNNADDNKLQHKHVPDRWAANAVVRCKDSTPSHQTVEGDISKTLGSHANTDLQHVPGVTGYKEGAILVGGKENSQKGDCKIETEHNVVRQSTGEELRISGAKCSKVRQQSKCKLSSEGSDSGGCKSNQLNLSEDERMTACLKRIQDEELERRRKREERDTNLSAVEQKIGKTNNESEECDPKQNTRCLGSRIIEKRAQTKTDTPKKTTGNGNNHKTKKVTKGKQKLELEKHAKKTKISKLNRGDLIPDEKPIMEVNSKKGVKQKSSNLKKFLEDIIHEEVCKRRNVKQSEPLPARLMIQYNGRVDEPVLKAIIESVISIKFKLILYESSDQKTSCVLECPSRKKSREALQQLKAMHYRDLEINLMLDMEVMAAKRRQEKEEAMGFVEQTARKLIQKHEEKVKAIENQIRLIRGNKHGDFSIISELETLESKLTELESQQKEFVRVLNSVLDKYELLDVRMADGCYRSKINKIKEVFTLEVLKFSTALPMYAKRSEILKCIENHPVSVILGETGSGKSTQMTQYIADAGFSSHGQIICTQPRKVAAITLAQRVAEEMATTMGGRVGYKVGTAEKRKKDTQIMYVTDHVLLNECITDPNLSRYSCIIIDEAHERSIYTDLLLGMVKKAIEKRSDLRVVITSATIDPEVFVKYFQDCPVLRVSGHTFPVTIHYDNNQVESLEPPQNYVEMAVDKVLWIHEHEPRGDILVFLTSPKETEKASELTEKRISSDKLCCFQLHGQQAPSDQQKVFRNARNGQRKVVFATNCAETSITIPGIKYVVDTGLSKEKHFDAGKNIAKLEVCYISKSSADQRKGRAGRTEPGQCYRLYCENVYNEMKSESTPEMLRCHLGQSLLKLMLLGIRNPMEFDFVEAPPRDSFKMAWQNLEELGAVNSDGLTDLGRELAHLSLEPRMGKLVIDGIENGIGTEAIIIASLAGVGYNIFFRGKTTKEQDISEKNKIKLSEIKGDVLTALEIYKEWSKVPEKEKRAWCKENSLNARWLRTAREDISELLKILDKELHRKVKYALADSSIVEKTLPSIILSCFSSNICYYMGHKRVGYSPLSKVGESFQIHPSSVVSCLRMEPQWIVFENILHTSQMFLINITVLTEEEAMNEIKKSGLTNTLEEIRANVVSRCEVPGIGPSVTNQLIRKKYGSMRRMEEELRVEFGKVKLALDRDVDSLVLYAKRDEQKAILSFIQSDAEPIKKELKMTCHETEIIQNGGIRCVIQPGGTLKTILMPNDSRTVLVQNVQEGISEDEIREHLSRFGKIENIIKYSKRNKSCWGKVIYVDHTSAIDASKNVAKDQLGFFVSLSIPKKDAEQYRLRVSFCRRPLLGFGFAIFRNPYMAAATGQTRINVCGEIVKVQLNRRNETELYFTGIPKDATINGIKEAFLAENIEVDDLRLPRKKQFRTSSRELEMYKRQLKSQFDDIGIENKYEINLFPPKDKDYTINGYITCTSLEIAEKLKEMEAFCQVDDHRAKVCMELQFQINEFISKAVYNAICSDLLLVLCKLRTDATPVRLENLQNGCFRFQVTVSNLNQLQTVKNHIDSVLKPKQEVISDQVQFHFMISGKGTEILHQIMNNYSVYIQFDQRSSVLSIYGTTERRQAAFEAVKEVLKDTDKYQVRHIPLIGEGKPPGILRDLFRRFKVDLEKLRAECGLANVYVMMRDHKLVICGMNEALDKCDAILQDVTSRLSETKELIQNEDQVTCPVCFCPVGENMYRMEYCTHVYCRECVNGLVHHAIKSKELPIQCAQEDCTEVLVLQDFFNLLGKSDENLKDLCTAATEKFVSKNNTRYAYCVTPDCPVVYKTTRTKHLFQCPNLSCQVQICTYCKDKYHEGLSCAMYQGLQSDPDYDLKAWMKQNPENRAVCPRCGYGIEKRGGCMHMHCIHCDAHFCWRCKRVFPTAGEVYDHQPTCPGH